MDLGRLLLRLTIGGTFFVHGTQKLFGWFGGYGPDGTGQFFESLALRPGRRNAIAAGSTETGCGILTVPGLATPLAAAGLSEVMITALRTAVSNEGFKLAVGQKQERDRHPFALLSWTMTRSAVGDACFLATEQSWRTAWRTRSLLSRTSCDSDSRNQGRSAVRAARAPMDECVSAL